MPVCAGDVSGKWAATLSSNGKDTRLHVEFRQRGEEVAGAFGQRADFLSPLGKARMAGDRLTFELKTPMSPGANFEGLVEGDRISGQLTSDLPALTGKLEMKRIGPPTLLPASLAPAAAAVDLGALSDEFDNPGTLKRWKSLSGAEGWPNRIEKMDVNTTSAGHLYVVPQSGAWWAGYHGVYLFQELKGDFVITTRVQVTGRGGGEPARMWTISGLLVRAPADLRIPREQRKENWIYVMTGRGTAEGRVVDAKSTLDSNNAWDVTRAEAGWYELGIGRIGPLFVALCRPDGGDWTVRKRIVREDLPETLQAGINVTSDFRLSASMPAAKYNAELFPGQSSPDSVTRFDFVRFSRPAVTPELRSRLAGKEVVAISDADLLALFR